MPFNPANIDTGAQYLAQGISSFGNSLGAGIQKHYDAVKKREEEDKFAIGLRSLFKKPVMAEKLGLTPVEIDKMGAHELAGVVQGWHLKSLISEDEAHGIANQRSQIALGNDQQKDDLNNAALQTQIDATKANQDRAATEFNQQQQEREDQQKFVAAYTAMPSGISEEDKRAQALKGAPFAFAGKDGPARAKAMSSLLSPEIKAVTVDGRGFAQFNGQLVPTTGIPKQPPTDLEKSTTRKNLAEATKIERDNTDATPPPIDHDALLTAVQDLAKGGASRVKLVKDKAGRITGIEPGGIVGFLNTTTSDATAMIKQQRAKEGKAGTAAPAGKMVRVTSPDGKVGSIPMDKLEAAKKAGYKEAE